MRKSIVIFWIAVVSIGCSEDSVGDKWVNVTNVEADDTLSVRAEPSVESEKLGELAFDQVGVRGRSSSSESDESNWIPVQSGHLIGWVNKHYVEPTEFAEFDDPLKCLGTEPFWSLDAEGGEITFSDMEESESTYAALEINPSQNHTNAWLFRLAGGDKEGRLMLTRTEQCTDDMSDRLYEDAVGFELPEGRFLTGCCNFK